MSENRSPIRLEQLYRLRNRAAEETDPAAVEALNVAIHNEAEIGRRSRLANAPPLPGDLVVVVYSIEGTLPTADAWLFVRFDSSDAIILQNGRQESELEAIVIGANYPRGYLGSTFFVHVDQAPLDENDPDAEIAEEKEMFWQNYEAQRDELAVEAMQQEDPDVLASPRDRATDRFLDELDEEYPGDSLTQPWTPEEQRADKVSNDMIDRDFDYMIEHMGEGYVEYLRTDRARREREIQDAEDDAEDDADYMDRISPPPGRP